MLSIRKISKILEHMHIKSKEMEKISHTNTKQPEERVSVSISDTANFRAKKVTRSKNEQRIKMNGFLVEAYTFV